MRRKRMAAILAALVFMAFIQFNAVLVWQTSTVTNPRPADVVVVIDGDNDDARMQAGIALVRAGYARVLVDDVRSFYYPGCQRAGVPTTLCFRATPNTTQGEARYIARAASKLQWRSIILVVTQNQAWRAKLRFSRCFSGRIQVVAVPTLPGDQIYTTFYQDAAIVKAEVWNRGC